MIPMPPKFDDPWSIKRKTERTNTWPFATVVGIFFIVLAYFFDLVYSEPGTSTAFIVVLGVWGVGLLVTAMFILSSPLKTTEIKTQRPPETL